MQIFQQMTFVTAQNHTYWHYCMILEMKLETMIHIFISVVPEDEGCTVFWYHYYQLVFPEEKHFFRQQPSSLGYCMHQCIHVFRNECRSVNFYSDTLKCLLFKTDSFQTSLSPHTSGYSFEWICHGNFFSCIRTVWFVSFLSWSLPCFSFSAY